MGAFKDLAIIEENSKQIAARKGSGLYRYRHGGPYAPALCIDCVSDTRMRNPEMKPNDWVPAAWVGWMFDACCDSCDRIPNNG